MQTRMFNILTTVLIFFNSYAFAMDDNMQNNKEEVAIFAMGCFWCGETEFVEKDTNKNLAGVLSITVGYAGGTKPNPTYQDHAGYKEAVKVKFNPETITYKQLLDIFWRNVDPFDAKGQFCDKGFAYTSAIFYANDTQREFAIKSKAEVEQKLKQQVVTEILPATTFYDAEEYHQDYHSKNPVRYKYYRWNCGRDKRLAEIWGSR